MTKLEQVARALAAVDFTQPWDQLDPDLQIDYMASARAAVKALRKPNGAGVQLAWELFHRNMEPRDFFSHLTDAILSEKPDAD